MEETRHPGGPDPARPCWRCAEREAGCHGRCALYAGYAEKRRKARAARAVMTGARCADAERGDKIRRDVRKRGLDGTRRTKR